MLKRFN